MVFTSPSWVPPLPSPPDSIPISEFMLNEQYGRRPLDTSRDPYTCGLSGKTYAATEIRIRVDNLAKAVAKELGWQVNVGTEYNKVAGIFSFNTIDLMTLSWAIHRLNGVSSPANAAYSAAELVYQLENSGATCLFTCITLLPTALVAAKKAGIPTERVFICPLSEELTGDVEMPPGMKTIDDLITIGKSLTKLDDLKWTAGQGARQAAFFCFSSGTSGLPKGVQISHYNVISNVLQRAIYEMPWRKQHSNYEPEIVLGVLPQNHIYALVVICHTSTYCGDQVIILPKYDFQTLLKCVARFKIQELFLVPPIIISMTKNIDTCRKYDLSSVKFIYTGAAPLGKETLMELQDAYPDIIARQAYGLTETSTLVCSQARDDIWPGSCGPLIPGVVARLISPDGKDIETYDTPGELWVKSPSVTIGYLGNKQATDETFVEDSQGRWMRTGDEVEIRRNPKNGNEHLWVVDRMKELIKVKGLQVSPAELEAHLLTHHSVADCAIIAIPSDTDGEVPKAYVVKSNSVGIEDNERMVKRDIIRHVQKHKAKYKWVKEVEFIDVIPKSASGKILRRLLRDKDREGRKIGQGAKL